MTLRSRHPVTKIHGLYLAVTMYCVIVQVNLSAVI